MECNYDITLDRLEFEQHQQQECSLDPETCYFCYLDDSAHLLELDD